ncbi:hypothetical protein M1L60_00795 [Actinoplanes sp. TRM 88003]|uniref:Uncharacterized protein n=1 Tax=Paractinoplanes aksuensis TaxID=2939490 RepID=A0ABT1DGC6_9ACTN|nr:hypothetical protein [Actinoplanes aksuensis]MCO8269121.1 hypothetical protein [Actinoplanes aksuensis]
MPSARSRRRSWTLALLGSLPQLFLTALLLVQGRNLQDSDAAIQTQLGLFASAALLFWSLIACAAVALATRTRPLAAPLASGSAVGLALSALIALAA